MRSTLRFWFAALLWSASLARAQWPHVNEKLTAGRVVIHQAVLLSAEVKFERIGTRGSEGSITEADQIAAAFYSSVAKELALRGVNVLPNPLDQARDDAARFAIADLQAKYNNVATQVRRKPNRVAKGRFTLGDRVALFEPGAAADVLVFMRGAGYLPTPGRNAISLATWGFAGVGPGFRGEIAFVHAKTGEVLVFLRFFRRRDMTKDADDRFAQSVREALHDVPLPMPPPRKGTPADPAKPLLE
jgi:hypothetical protein